MSKTSATTMAKEIAEQPQALQDTLEALGDRRTELRHLVRHVRHVVFFARGSSDSAATYGRYLVEIVAGKPSAMGAPSVATLYHAEQDLSGSLAVLCSQSGRTEEIAETAQWARDCGARTVAVTNEADTPLGALVDLALVTRAGTERAVPATKSHSTCLLAMAEIAAALAPDPTVLHRELPDVPDDAARLLVQAAEPARHAAHAVTTARAIAVTGRGFSYATALELALKIEETSLLPCLGLSQADLQHGPQAVLDPATPMVVASAAAGPTLPGLQVLAESAVGRGSPVVVLGGSPALRELADWTLPGSSSSEPVAPITQIIPGQLFAETLARLLGHEPDAPPGLSKVTRTA
jgi:glucosamine--fructose-6-phosphate aminotransferase (isomerizing)